MYVDESGDTGLGNSPTRYFALSGLVVHESRWRDFVNVLIQFKRTMKEVYGLPVRAEIHASEYINSRVYGLERHLRLAILRNLLDELAKLDYISITNVVVDKNQKPADYDVFERAWQALFQRFENTLVYGNFPGGHRNDFGMVITDATNGTKLTRLVRRMSVYNPVPIYLDLDREICRSPELLKTRTVRTRPKHCQSRPVMQRRIFWRSTIVRIHTFDAEAHKIT